MNLRLSVILLFAFFASGCAERTAPPVPLVHDEVPPGSALPEAIDAFLYGDAVRCMSGKDCVSGACYYGTCTGLLVIDQRWLQDEISGRLATHLDQRPAQTVRVVAHLAMLLSRPGSDEAIKGRAVLALEALKADEALVGALDGQSEAVTAAAALALTRLGRDEGLLLTQALSESPKDALAIEALRTLGARGRPESLTALLRALSPSQDGAVLSAALEAIAALGDKRAAHALVAWLKRAPEYLKLDTVKTLRSLTDQTLGADPSAWERWLSTAAIPLPPPFQPRNHDPTLELGLPTP